MGFDVPKPSGRDLAKRLKQLRVEEWPGAGLTQGKLAQAFTSDTQHVGSGAVSTWESSTAPKIPPLERVADYARFFATRRSLDNLRLISQLTVDEEARRVELELELTKLRQASGSRLGPPVQLHRTWQFNDSGPISLICADTPEEFLGALGKEDSLNFTEMHAMADSDALIKLYGHIRAENPNMSVRYCRDLNLTDEDLTGHVVFIGGDAWSDKTRELRESLELPVRQVRINEPVIPEGDIFEISDEDGAREVYPGLSVAGTKVYGPVAKGRHVDLIDDVGWFARMPNPWNGNRTLTICSGSYSRGVVGSVLAFTHEQFRDANEAYVGERFNGCSKYTLLFRVKVYPSLRTAVPPDLNKSGTCIYEWSEPPRPSK